MTTYEWAKYYVQRYWWILSGKRKKEMKQTEELKKYIVEIPKEVWSQSQEWTEASNRLYNEMVGIHGVKEEYLKGSKSRREYR